MKSLYIQEWILFEVLMFYGRIFNTALFIFYIQVRGSFGLKDDELNESRFKYDALDYYEIDLNWTCYQSVPIFLIGIWLWREQFIDHLEFSITTR